MAAALRAIGRCGREWVRGSCAEEHVYAACLFCGRLGCGCEALVNRVAGPRLQRRVMRVWPHLSWATTWGQVVVTVPPELHEEYRSRKALAKLQRITAEVAAYVQPEAPGSHVVLHYFGDKDASWHPHGNGLIPLPPGVSSIVPHERLDGARELIAACFGVPVERAQFHYSFRPVERRAHALRYMERDTLYQHRDEVSAEDLALVWGELKGFRRSRGYGQLADSKWGAFSRTDTVLNGWHKDEDGDTDAEHVARGECSLCGSPIAWEKRLFSSRAIEAMGSWESLSAGYWRLNTS